MCDLCMKIVIIFMWHLLPCWLRHTEILQHFEWFSLIQVSIEHSYICVRVSLCDFFNSEMFSQWRGSATAEAISIAQSHTPLNILTFRDRIFGQTKFNYSTIASSDGKIDTFEMSTSSLNLSRLTLLFSSSVSIYHTFTRCVSATAG